MNNKFNPYQRPPANICPQEYCLHWSLNENSKIICCTSPGKCRRIDLDCNTESYQYNAKKLAEDGLPWFYFTSFDCIVDVLREKYASESKEFWGENYFGNPNDLNNL